jgi:methylmalonyl-CoA/ethylmalonyl-CoA epimerase
MLSQLGQFALPVSNADVAEVFYGTTLGLPRLFRFGDLVFFDCNGVRLMLEQKDEQVTPSAGICHYFKVEPLEKTVTELESRGVIFESQPHLIAEMPDHQLWMAFFKDPDGHMLALMEERR